MVLFPLDMEEKRSGFAIAIGRSDPFGVEVEIGSLMAMERQPRSRRIDVLCQVKAPVRVFSQTPAKKLALPEKPRPVGVAGAWALQCAGAEVTTAGGARSIP